MAALSENLLLAAAREEIEAFHGFFDDWFRGDVPKDEALLEAGHGDRLAEDFQLTYPGGITMGKRGLVTSVGKAHGCSAEFGVQIRDVRLRPLACEDYIFVNYEEWQKNAVNSTPSNNARISSALFRIIAHDPVKLEWLHLHETWLPRAVMDAGPFDF